MILRRGGPHIAVRPPRDQGRLRAAPCRVSPRCRTAVPSWLAGSLKPLWTCCSAMLSSSARRRCVQRLAMRALTRAIASPGSEPASKLFTAPDRRSPYSLISASGWAACEGRAAMSSSCRLLSGPGMASCPARFAMASSTTVQVRLGRLVLHFIGDHLDSLLAPQVRLWKLWKDGPGGSGHAWKRRPAILRYRSFGRGSIASSLVGTIGPHEIRRGGAAAPSDPGSPWLPPQSLCSP